MVALSWVYAVHGDIAWVSGIFEGLAWGVVGIVAAALLRIGSKTLRAPVPSTIAAVAFLALFLFGVPFPVVVLGAGVVGLVAGGSLAADAGEATDDPVFERVRPTLGRTARVLAVGLGIWLVPLGLVVAADPGGVLAEEALFFSTMALVTFGGAYAVLSYVQQAAVVRFGWLSSSEMAVGLSLAETTPGPLILVVVFVGFIAAYREPGSLPAVAAGVAGALVAAWATFVPSFLFIFLGAPSVERLRGRVRLAGALAAITAAVVGVIANLAVVFATSVLFTEIRTVSPFDHDVALPVASSVFPLAVGVATAAFVAIHRFRVNVAWVVLGAGLVGLADTLVG
jgi:chromate transporter